MTPKNILHQQEFVYCRGHFCLSGQISFRLTWKNNNFPDADEIELKEGESLQSERPPILLLHNLSLKTQSWQPAALYGQTGWYTGPMAGSVSLPLKKKQVREEYVSFKGLGSPSLKLSIILIL